MKLMRSLTVLATSIGVVAGAAQAQDLYETARRTVQAAQVLQVSGRWSDAQAQLSDAEKTCGTDVQGRPCRLLVKYSTGYLAEKEAAAAGERGNTILESAAAEYRDVLKEAPQHEATLRNLAAVYRRLGRKEDAERVLQQAAESDRSGTGAAAMLLGQFYREEARFGDALGAFERAAAANPTSAAAPEAIVALHADAPPEMLATLLPRLDDWAGIFPAVSEGGYRRILVRMPNTPTAERALVAWTSVIARQGWIAPANFAGLPRGWSAIDELVSYAASPETEPTRGWWMQQPLRRSVLAEVALATGQAAEVRTSPPRGLRRLQVGMRIAPGYEDYLFNAGLKNAWPARMELARAQLSLLSREPALDPSAKLQLALIGELFAGKAGAYRSEDLAAMQRFHVTLGHWYAERHEWSGTDSTNGRFQLEHAIETAARRATQGEPYQPLQEEKLLLATGYEKLKELAKARSMYLQAAEAFLDTDQLQPANDALDAGKRITTPAQAAAELSRTEFARRVIATRALVAAKAAGPDPKDKDQAWLRDDSSQPFVMRQRFKVWADLADKARATGAEDAAATYASTAFEAAVRSKSMVGTADLVRLERAKSLALARADLAQKRNAIVTARPVHEPEGEVLPVYVPSESRAYYVSLSADAALAGRFDVATRREFTLSGQAVRYTVDNGRIAIAAPGADESVTAAVDRLRAVPGVKSLTLAR